MHKKVALRIASILVTCLVAASPASAQNDTNPVWRGEKIKNYLPHMSWPEVEDLLTRTDMVIIPVGALEQHGHHLPIGTDFLNGLERAKLIAQRTDVLVAPILMPGNSPYHLGFPGTISLSTETIQKVHVEAVQSLIHHGFKRFLILNSHGGNRVVSRYIADRVNHETAGIAVELGEAAAPFMERPEPSDEPAVFDRHAGVGETSRSMYLIPSLVDMDKAVPAKLTHLDHLDKMLPEVIAGEPTALRVFLAEALKAEKTGKRTTTREMTSTGVWSARPLEDATAQRGRESTEAFVVAAVRFIERWKQLRPLDATK